MTNPSRCPVSPELRNALRAVPYAGTVVAAAPTPVPSTGDVATPATPAMARRPAARRSKEPAAAGEAIIAAFRGGASVAAIAQRYGCSPRAVEWQLKKAGLKTNDRRRPRANETGDKPPEDMARSCRRQDLAFQNAMRRAIAAGKENPPMTGVFTDPRPLDAPRLFEPVPHASGCTSPARECADLVRPVD
jgi:transposase-like protein